MATSGDIRFVPRSPKRGARAGTMLRGAALGLALTHCDPEPNALDSPPPLALRAPAGAESHADHDCRTAHPPPAAGPPAIALSAETRQALTTLRISAHVGAVILRRRGAEWITAGEQGCRVAPARIERALDSLSALSAAAPAEPPGPRATFVLQVVALIGEKPVLQFSVADRNALGDLVALEDGSTLRVRGLNRELLSPNPDAWCR